jgi:hypothetical protein
MGQPITIDSRTVDGTVAAFHTDRSITGQDGVAFASADVAGDSKSLPGDLARQLFESDDAINHVFIASNQVVVGRSGDWAESALDAADGIISAFFVFYPEG